MPGEDREVSAAIAKAFAKQGIDCRVSTKTASITKTEHGIEAALLEVGDEHVELLASLSEDSSVGRFLADRGPGMHHVAYRVADIDAAFADLLARGVEMIDAAPRPGLRDSRIAFIHPRSTGGVLTEIVEAAAG